MKINLSIDTQLAQKILTGFIRTEVTRAGFKRAVVALSGGLDSSLSCMLASTALGPENVLAVLMPYKTSAPDSVEHARMLVEMIGVHSLTVPITEVIEPLIEEIPPEAKIRRGNIMARTRMMVVYDQSAAFQGLVVGTSNKTEILLGYSTLYGDSACAINPLGDLYKTQVRQLAGDMGVPRGILDKPPSADLWPGQTDESELGFTYEEVDKLLYLLVDHRFNLEECVDAGFKKPFVEEVLERIRKSQYKRMLPPIAKLSNRTVGYDFLYLRDWGT